MTPQALSDREQTPLYSIGTWDTHRQAFTPHRGLSVPSFNITILQLRVAMRELQETGYRCHRYRGLNGGEEDNDTSVIIERTDGQPWLDIRRGWNR